MRRNEEIGGVRERKLEKGEKGGEIERKREKGEEECIIQFYCS
jgi:hypothetical protein